MDFQLRPVPGFLWCGKNIGIKTDSLDLGVIFSETVCEAAGVFTRNNIPGAAILVGKEHLLNGQLQAIVVNSKNANVATGQQGMADARKMCAWTGETLGIAPDLILPSSTGVIGKFLPIQKIENGLKNIRSLLGESPRHIQEFATAIMTTDTYPKWVSLSFEGVTMTGVAKGSGMIEPNMATMLSYFVTDASLSSKTLSEILKRVVDKSFNRISVDTDTSTSDTVVILANGKGKAVEPDVFERYFQEMAIHLAKEIVQDGEGATKLIELTVSGADSSDKAFRIAKSVINSPLVKTAIFGADPNWGRFVMAVGKVYEYPVALEDLKISFGKEEPRPFIDFGTIANDRVDLPPIKELLKRPEIFIEIKVGQGSHAETVWGCDLTEGYIRINADYTT